MFIEASKVVKLYHFTLKLMQMLPTSLYSTQKTGLDIVFTFNLTTKETVLRILQSINTTNAVGADFDKLAGRFLKHG